MAVVLLVHEDTAARDCLAAILGAQGHTLNWQVAPQAALDEVLSASIDLVVVAEACATLAGDSLASVLRSAGYAEKVVQLYVPSGKVLSPDDLADEVDAVVIDPGDSIPDWESFLKAHLPTAAPGRWDHLTFESLAGFDRLKARFYERLPAQLEAIRASSEGHDWPALGRHAHALKGSAACYGLPDVSSLAQKVEHLASTPDVGGIDRAVSELIRVASSRSANQEGNHV
ncbi:MAG: Hpt domain-containing protein [Burkholderiales bacterium]|nr:Hpt domain-containing protein [Burkholderiales bacterium]